MTGSSASTMPTLMIIWPSSQTTMPKVDVAHERVLGAARDPQRGEGDGEEEHDDEQRADQAELLAEHGEDEVGVGLGQVAPLLLAGADALAEDAAGGRARTGRGPAASRRRGSRLNGSAKLVIRSSRSALVDGQPEASTPTAVEHRRRRTGPGRRPPTAAPSMMREQHQRGAEVAAEDHEPDDQHQPGHHRHDHLVQAARAAAPCARRCAPPTAPSRAWRSRRAGSGTGRRRASSGCR